MNISWRIPNCLNLKTENCNTNISWMWGVLEQSNLHFLYLIFQFCPPLSSFSILIIFALIVKSAPVIHWIVQGMGVRWGGGVYTGPWPYGGFSTVARWSRVGEHYQQVLFSITGWIPTTPAALLDLNFHVCYSIVTDSFLVQIKRALARILILRVPVTWMRGPTLQEKMHLLF